MRGAQNQKLPALSNTRPSGTALQAPRHRVLEDTGES